MINVLGDAYGAGIVQHLSKKELENTTENLSENFSENFRESFSEDDEGNIDELNSNFSNSKLVRTESHENQIRPTGPSEKRMKMMQTYL